MAARKNERLRDYRHKRSADRTPEPFGGDGPTSGKLFVVQHHAARALHYDLRLEMEGVLRSWAVPKGPSPNPTDKRLAVAVEDHPLEYANFEGRIPEGNYGAGASIIWDRGIWLSLTDPAEGLIKGKLLFELRGYKLRGKWTLIKTRRGPKDWLLIKERDGWASNKNTDSYPPDSILSGLTVEELKNGHDPAKTLIRKLKRFGARKKRVRARETAVMLAQSSEPFSRAGWLFEIKYDGYRLLAAREQDEVRLSSRAGNDLTATFPEISHAVHALPFEHLIIDGEVVVHDESGIPSFGLLQKRGRLNRPSDIRRAAAERPATFYVFDALAFGDYDLRSLPLVKRKTILRELLPSIGPLRYSDHIERQGETMYEHARELGLEGIIAKKMDSPYRAGRSSHWLKIKVEQSDDFVVAGYTRPKGSQPGFGALLLAQYEDDTLIYRGRVGSGFSGAQLNDIGAQFKSFKSTAPPRAAPKGKDIHWVEPTLVCEVRYTEITPDGVLRAPVFLRLRADKRPIDCIRRTAEPRLVDAPARVPHEAAERTVQFSNLEKVFWPQVGYTKGDLIAYYRSIAAWLLPYLEDRPVVLTRYPEGVEGKSFFQKDAPDFVPPWLRTERLWSEGSEREINYFIVNSVEPLLYIINMASIPLHIWSSRLSHLERPDWCILDLDPKGAPFTHVVKIAQAIRKLCKEIGLPSFVKTSGSTGLHVLLPLGHRYTYEQSRSLAELLARVVVTKLPEIATVARAVSTREGRVYIDYLQNGHGRLLVSPFSVRPLPGAPVSMPLKWTELTSRLAIGRFTISTAVKRMHTLKQDPLRPVLDMKPNLNAALERLRRRLGRVD
jgi:bifunctional non-homologous end joining protein LigD